MKVANLTSRIGNVSLSERSEMNESNNKRVFVSKDPKVIIPSTITTVQEDAEMVSLGDEEPYQTNSLSDEEALYQEFISGDCAYGAEMTKYGNGLLSNKLTKNYHTVKTTVQTVNQNRHSSYHISSVDTCYISDSPQSTLGPEPFPEDTRATSLVTFHVLSDKPRTRTLPGLPCAMAYAKSPLFTFYYMTHPPYLHFPLSCYH